MSKLPSYLTRKASQESERIKSGVPMPGAQVMRALAVGGVDKEARTLELSFSSDDECLRWPGFVEVLDHSLGAVDMSRLNARGPLLFNHNLDDVIGVIESAEIGGDGKGRALVRFGRSKRADEVWNDVQDGILSNVSVGYRIHEVKLQEKRDDGNDVYLVTKWEPYEISIVTAPADTTVGIGRSITPNQKFNQEKETRMNEAQLRALLAKRNVTIPDGADIEALTRLVMDSEPSATTPATTGKENGDAAKGERARVTSIMDAGRKFGVEQAVIDKALADGVDINGFRELVLEAKNKRDANLRQQNTPLGLTEKETQQFSIIRLLRAAVDPTDRKAQKEAAFELDVTRSAADARGKETKGLYVPLDILRAPLLDSHGRAIVSVGTITATGTGTVDETVANTLLSGSFWEMLRNRTTFLRLARTLGGLVGNYDVPYQTSGAAAAWLGSEDAEAALTDVNFGHKSLSPKTLACYAEITRKSLQQSSLDVEAFVRADLAKAMAHAVDRAGFYGTGAAGQPTGIKETDGIQFVGFAGSNPTWIELVNMETEIEADNIDASSSRYVFNARMRGHTKTTQKFPGTPTGTTIWEGNGVNGYGAEVTNQIGNGEVFFGDFSEVIVGQWGGLDILVDPYTHSTRGRIRIVNFQDWDFMVRRPEALAWGIKTSESGS